MYMTIVMYNDSLDNRNGICDKFNVSFAQNLYKIELDFHQLWHKIPSLTEH